MASAPPAALLAGRAGRVLLLGPDAPRDDIDWQPLQQTADGAPLFERGSCADGVCLRFAQAVDPATMPGLLDPDFPSRLRDLLQPPPAPRRIAAADLTPSTGADAWPPTPRDLRPWWALLVALAFALERWMAAAALLWGLRLAHWLRPSCIFPSPTWKPGYVASTAACPRKSIEF